MATEPTDGTRKLVRGALLLGGALLVSLLLCFLYSYPPTDDSYYPKCALHTFTGLHCPGCGLTRSASSLLHGELSQSLAYNPLWPLFLPLIAWGVGTSLWNDRFPNRSIRVRWPRWVRVAWPWALAGTLLAFGVLRNIPAHPFDLLAPHEVK